MRPLQLAIACSATLVMAACAGTQDRADSSSRYVPPRSSERIVPDAEYVALVERNALRRGVDVQWVHVPHKRIAKDD